jgi:biopolymer transport protein ExbD
MRLLLPQPRKKVAIDVSLAIINIVLLLIFFFLTTGQLLNPHSGDVELAETTELPLDQLPSPILVVYRDGSWAIDGTPVAPELLGLALATLPKPVILHLLINRDAPASSLLTVIDRPELANVELRLVTLRRTPEP